jgi:hypothetical protein
MVCLYRSPLSQYRSADCCTALGLDVVKHVKSGWKIKQRFGRQNPSRARENACNDPEKCSNHHSGARQLRLFWSDRRRGHCPPQPVHAKGQGIPCNRCSRCGLREVDLVICDSAQQADLCLWRQTDLHPLCDAQVYYHAML